MRSRQAGFTLVELLLAMTLMALLMALAYGGLRAGWKASESGQQLLEEAGELRITHQFIRRQLNLMLPLAFAAAEGDDSLQATFEGSDNTIVFVGPMPGYLARGGPQVQVMSFVDGENGLDLNFTHAPLQDFEREFLIEQEPVVLLEGLQAGAFEFLELDEEGQPLGWTAEWENPAILPRAVRLNLQFPQEYGVTWPELIATVRLDATATLPGGSNGQTYAERIQEMLKRQGSGRKQE